VIQRLRSQPSATLEPIEEPAPSLPHPEHSAPALPPEEDYLAWLSRHEPTTADLQAMRSALATWTERPLMSILMPVYNSRRSWLQEAVGSVLGQVYPEWELCIADDASPNEEVRRWLEDFRASDPRIRVSFRDENGGIAQASTTAMSMAKGEVVVLLDHDDVLRPHALFEVAKRFRSDPTVDMVYSDEDKIRLDGTHGHPAFKPDWSPHFLLSINYVCHLTALRTSVVREAGGFRTGFDGSQDHDLFLRVSEKARKIEHIPKVLYAWKQVPGSAATALGAKPAAHEAGTMAVSDALRRRGIAGRVEDGAHAGLYNVRCEVKGSPTVEILVSAQGDVDHLSRCIDSIGRRTNSGSYRITIIGDPGYSVDARDYLEHTPHKVLPRLGRDNFATMLNAAWRSSKSDYLVLAHAGVIVCDPQWLDVLLEQAQLDDVAFVGCAINDRDGNLRHCGIKIADGEAIAMSSMQWPVIRDVSAVSRACAMIARGKLEALGGFDERYSTGMTVTDMCLRAVRRGLYNVFTPLTSVMASEAEDEQQSDDAMLLKRAWTGGGIASHDPFDSVHVINWRPLRFRVAESLTGDTVHDQDDACARVRGGMG
jgi:glycosyltransferase involved in cell wall biosynthesis